MTDLHVPAAYNDRPWHQLTWLEKVDLALLFVPATILGGLLQRLAWLDKHLCGGQIDSVTLGRQKKPKGE